MSRRLDWKRDGADWPNRTASRFVNAGGMKWHVQVLGQGPVVLLLHGTGAATHSWRAVARLLARHFEVVAPDLPGHAFSDALPSAPTLPAMATAVAELMKALQLSPELIVGHSAGAAIALRAVLDGKLSPRGVVSINGALVPFKGLAGLVFAPAARLFFSNSIVSRLVAYRARDKSAVRRLIMSTGSDLDPEGELLYARLVASPAHVHGALGMMAHWDLGSLQRDLPRLSCPLLRVMATNDRMLQGDEARRQRALLPRSELVEPAELGHLAHEEQPEQMVEIIESFARRCGVLTEDHARG